MLRACRQTSVDFFRGFRAQPESYLVFHIIAVGSAYTFRGLATRRSFYFRKRGPNKGWPRQSVWKVFGGVGDAPAWAVVSFQSKNLFPVVGTLLKKAEMRLMGLIVLLTPLQVSDGASQRSPSWFCLLALILWRKLVAGPIYILTSLLQGDPVQCSCR